MGNTTTTTSAPTSSTAAAAPNPWAPQWSIELHQLIPSNSRLCNNFTYEFEYPVLTTNKWDYVYHLLSSNNISISDGILPRPDDWNMCFCGKGSVFVWFLTMSLIILIVSGGMTLYVFKNMRTDETVHRRVLFVCLLAASIVRAVYSAICLHKIIHASTMQEVLTATNFFVKTLVPVMALSDWFSGLVDVAMALFWYTLHTGRRYHITVFTLVSIATLKVLGMLVLADVNYVSANPDADARWFFNATLWYVAIIVFFGAVSHIVVGCMVLKQQLSTTSEVVFWARAKALWPLLTIVIVTAVTGIFRAGVLIGRQAGVPLFYSGALSFNSPTFTEWYFIAIMQLPPLIVSMIAAAMTSKGAREQRRVDQIAEGLVLDRGSGYGGTGNSGRDGGSEVQDDPDM